MSERDQSQGNRHDLAPGDEAETDHDIYGGIRGYVIGLGAAALLTAASFWAATTGLIYGPGVPLFLIALAIGQMGVHLVFFLHITTGPDNTNNVLALGFGVLIVVLVLFGTILIMDQMNAHMMSEEMMRRMMQGANPGP